MIKKLVYFIGCVVVFSFMVNVLVILLLVILSVSSCVEATDGCTPGESICDGPTVLKCDELGNWEPEYCWDDQNKTCCSVDDLHFCSKVCNYE